MPSEHLALSVRGLGKEYRIRPAGHRATTLAEALVARLRHPLAASQRTTFRALEEVSFDLPRGEALGVLGRNGAGKSTLLKIISRVTAPTSGEARVWGRVGSLLEVETGFHPELTGRENVFLKGAVLGMRRSEIARVFEEIVDFAGVELFLDTPVKRYSSGMRVRLGFAVAAHLRSEILLIDEVLAVGDVDFQRRCLGRMDELSRGEGRTLILVSHDMRMIEAVCTRALILDKGRVVSEGATAATIQRYEEMAGSTREFWHVSDPELQWRGIQNVERLRDLRADEDISFLLGFRSGEAAIRGLHVDLTLRNERNEIVVHTRSPFVCDGLEVDRYSDFEVRYTIRSPKLVAGRYFLTVYAAVEGARVLLWVDNVDACVVAARAYFGRAEVLAGFQAPIVPEYSIALENVRRSPRDG
jgi:lipopolysaccharide transport system ATP-binding protein